MAIQQSHRRESRARRVSHDRLGLKSGPVADLASSARPSASPSEVAAGGDICSVVMNDRQTEAVFLQDDGVFAGVAPGSLILIHSTISQEMCQVLGEAARDKGVHILDAAVSGAEAKAKEGKLTVLVGGEADQVKRARPIFDVIGVQTFHVGGLGMGQAAKVCNNLMCLVNVQVIEEAFALAQPSESMKISCVMLFSAARVTAGRMRISRRCANSEIFTPVAIST